MKQTDASASAEAGCYSSFMLGKANKKAGPRLNEYSKARVNGHSYTILPCYRPPPYVQQAPRRRARLLIDDEALNKQSYAKTYRKILKPANLEAVKPLNR